MLAVLDLECSSEAQKSVKNARLGKIEMPPEPAQRENKNENCRRKNKDIKQETPPPPYLDRIVTTGHTPTTTREDWRRLLIQPVSIPALAHTGLTSAFSVMEDEPLIRPDGSRSKQLSNMVKTSVRSCNSLRAREESRMPGNVKSRQRGLPRELQAIESSTVGVPTAPMHRSHLKRNNKKRGNRETSDARKGSHVSNGSGDIGNMSVQTAKSEEYDDDDDDDEEKNGHEEDAQSAVMNTLRNHTMRARARAETSEDARNRRKSEILRNANEGYDDNNTQQDMPAHYNLKTERSQQALSALGTEPPNATADTGTGIGGGVTAYDQYEKKRRTKVKKVIAARSSTRMLLESMLDSVYGKTR